MRARRYAAAVALACAAALVVPTAPGAADPGGDPPTQEQVDQARAAVDAATADVDSVRAALAAAERELETAQVAAARAAEAFNGARYQAQQAARASRVAERRSTEARLGFEAHRQAYAQALTASYQLAPQLGALAAVSQADGITEVLESTAALQNAEDALSSRYDAYDAAAKLAQAADEGAQQALDTALATAGDAREARDQARDAADAAAAQTAHFAGQRDELLGQLARLQNISVALAEEREDELAQAAAAAAEAAAQQAAAEQAAAEQAAAEQAAAEQAAAEQAAAEQAAAEQAADAAQDAQDQATQPPPSSPSPSPSPTATPTPVPTATPTPTPMPTPTAAPTPPAPPAPPPPPSGGAAAAIGFAQQQLGEPYKYGAAGPSAWDCSGLTMMAWRSGGKTLPHYSVAQYEQSTPIAVSQLQPGDLLFWGSSSKSSSIYHVALYVGNGQMIHAPRPGQPVQQVSMYYWITPNLFARP